MKKRGLTLALATAMILTLLVGCGSKETSEGNQSIAGPTATASTSALPDNCEIVIKFGHNDGEVGLLETPYYAYSRVSKNMVETLSGGRIGVQVFPSNQLGDLPSMLEQTINGTIQMTAGQNTGLLASYFPKIQVLDIPYAFPDLDTALTMLNGEYGEELNQELIETAGVRILSYLPTAMRNFASNKDLIKSADDIKGMKVRVMEIPLHQAMVTAYGGIPTTISFAELYSALQTGVVDAQEQAPYTMVMNNLQEVTKYYTLSEHLLNSNACTMNEAFFQSLSKEDQQIILKAAKAAQRAMIGITTANEPEVYDKMTSAGVQVYAPTEAELETFRTAGRQAGIDYMVNSVGVSDEYINDFFARIDQIYADAMK